MRPYKTYKLIDGPDCADLVAEGRPGHVGHLPGKSGEYHGNARDASSKRQTRRRLKRSDKARVDKMIEKEMED